MNAVQCKLARTALGWNVIDLSRAAKVSTNTIVRLERGDRVRDTTHDRIRKVFEDGGIEFIPEDGSGFGIRIKLHSTHQSDRLAINETKKLSGAQIRAARGLLEWTSEDLARRANVGISTIRRAEAESGVPSTTASNLGAIQTTFEDGGIVFIPENGGGVGVRFKKPVN